MIGSGIRNRLAAALAASALLAGGCDGGSAASDMAKRAFAAARPRVTIVLFDTSRSVEPADRGLYADSLGTLAPTLRGGDRVLLAPIGDQTRSNFLPALDIEVRRTDVRLDQEEEVAAAAAELTSRGRALVAAPSRSGRTGILEAIAAASEAFRATPEAERVLIVLSDGVEESPICDLSGVRITSTHVSAALDRAHAAGLLPDLRGVKLSIIGSGGRDFAGVQLFWNSYARHTGADLVSYGRLPYRPPGRTAPGN